MVTNDRKESRASGAYLRVFIVASAVALAGMFAAAIPSVAQESTNPEPHIVGGQSVPNGKYPFMVSLQSERIRSDNGHFCGGTLIDSDSILTAAHCTDIISRTDTDSSVAFDGIRVVVGRTVLSSDQGQTKRIANFSDIEMHPRFNSRTYAYDAAVIDLASPVKGITPVKLSTAGQNGFETPGSSATIAGWGNTIAQDRQDVLTGTGEVNTPDRMREANVPIVSDTKARNSYQNVDSKYVPKLMVAAGKQGKDTCQGDSGGPLFKGTANGRVQIGITSFGFGCAQKNYPGVYAEVNSPDIRSFIVNAND